MARPAALGVRALKGVGRAPGSVAGPPAAPAPGAPGSPGSLAGRALLVLALVQGTSVTLSFAVRLDPSGRAATLVTLVWLAGYALAAWTLLARDAAPRIAWLARYRSSLLLLVAGVIASISWSIAPALSAERAVHLTGSTLVALAIGFTVPLAALLRIAAVAFGAIMLGSVAAALLMPSIGIENYQGRAVWRGVTASKNTLGFWAAASVLLFAVRALGTRTRARRAGDVALGLVSLLCLFKSVSATSALALGAGLAAMAYLQASASLRLGPLASGALALLGAALAAFALGTIDTVELIGRSGDLTGRAELWEQTRALIASRPLTGYGYGTIWYPTETSLWIQRSLLELGWVTYHAHNGPLQLASEIGVPLTALALVFALQQLVEIVHCRHRRNDPGLAFVFGFTIALLVSNYAEARLVVNRELYWILMVALPVSMLRQVTLHPSAARAGVPRPAPRRLSPGTRAALAGRRRSSIARTALKASLAARLDAGTGARAGSPDSPEPSAPHASSGSPSRPPSHPPSPSGDPVPERSP